MADNYRQIEIENITFATAKAICNFINTLDSSGVDLCLNEYTDQSRHPKLPQNTLIVSFGGRNPDNFQQQLRNLVLNRLGKVPEAERTVDYTVARVRTANDVLRATATAEDIGALIA